MCVCVYIYIYIYEILCNGLNDLECIERLQRCDEQVTIQSSPPLKNVCG